MPEYLTPGLYFEPATPRTAPGPQRTDVAGFVGVAERGPLHTPVRITTWREFQAVFGGPVMYAHLAYAVRAFFDNGGDTAWIVRVAHAASAREATADIPAAGGGVSFQVRAANPGRWGNELSLSLQVAGVAAAQHRVVPTRLDDEGQDTWLAVTGITGFQPGRPVRLTQALDGGLVQVQVLVRAVDVAGRQLRFDRALALLGLDPDSALAPAISVESLEFTLLLWEKGQVAERFVSLPVNQAAEVVNARSRLIRLQGSPSAALPELSWRGPLTGGLNGLRDLDIYDLVGGPGGEVYGLAALAGVDEASILAMPDLTWQPVPAAPARRAPHRQIEPCALDTPARRAIVGQVLNAETGLPLASVQVEVNDGLHLHCVLTDSGGGFTLPPVLLGTVELVLRREGFEEAVSPVIVAAGSGPQVLDEPLRLSPVDLPPGLSEADIYLGQASMVAQCERLRDRFALIDPPLNRDGSLPDASGIQAWRARFDTAFAALYYPWLRVADPLQPGAAQGRFVPPSGHVAGVYATTDCSEGVHRPPANRALAWVDDVGLDIDDALQAVLNPRGINAIRILPGRGVRILGARTMSSDTAWQFVNVRRLMSMIEEVLYDDLQWAVFEPNDRQLELGLRLAIGGFLDSLWRRGALVGDTPAAAYEVRCDEHTTLPEDRVQGRIVAEVLVAPTVPYEFIVLRLGLTADELQISEV